MRNLTPLQTTLLKCRGSFGVVDNMPFPIVLDDLPVFHDLPDSMQSCNVSVTNSQPENADEFPNPHSVALLQCWARHINKHINTDKISWGYSRGTHQLNSNVVKWFNLVTSTVESKGDRVFSHKTGRWRTFCWVTFFSMARWCSQWFQMFSKSSFQC